MKGEKTVITTKELGNYVLKERKIPTPIYREKDRRESIVCSRSIWDMNNKRKRKIKL